MKVTGVMVESLDGRITNGEMPGTAGWASDEDQDFFREQIAAADSLIMGRGTYEVAKDRMEVDPAKPRIIMTYFPDMYDDQERPGLEFTDLSPTAIVKGLVGRGFKRALLVGGAEANAAFLNEDQLDEMYITAEPILFGAGRPLVGKLDRPVRLKLLTVKHLNEDTLLKHYRVIKSADA